jgi:hypothetical protein
MAPDANKGLIIAGWSLLGGAVLLAAIPLLNFLLLILGSAILLACLIISVILLSRGRNGAGLSMLLTTLIGAPVAMVILFFLSNLVFAAGVASQVEKVPTPEPLVLPIQR